MESTRTTAANAGPPERKSPSAFAYRHYRIYLIGSYAAFLGQRLTVVALAILVFDMTGSALKLGLVATASALPTILFNLFGGVLADRVETRVLLRFSALATTIMLGTLAVLIATDAVRVWQVFVIATLSGLVIGFDGPARQAYFPTLVPPRAIRSAVNLNGSMMASASVVMPAIGGIIIASFGTGAGFFIAAAGYAGMTASTWLLPRRKIVVDRGRNVVSDLKEGVVFIARTRIFAVLIGLSFANVFFVFGYIQVLPAFVDVFGGGDTKVGYLFSAAGIGALSGIVVAGRVHPGRYLGWLILGAAFFFSVLIFAVASSPSYSLALVLVALAHFGNGMFMIMTMTVLQLRVPDAMRGRVMGIYAMNQSLAVLGGLWAGSISGLFNPRVGVAAGPVVVIALIFVIALTQRAVTGLRDDVESRSTGRRFAR